MFYLYTESPAYRDPHWTVRSRSSIGALDKEHNIRWAVKPKNIRSICLTKIKAIWKTVSFINTLKAPCFASINQAIREAIKVKADHLTIINLKSGQVLTQ